jgi:hypothetical protein
MSIRADEGGYRLELPNIFLSNHDIPQAAKKNTKRAKVRKTR